jgi:hypothetical protein
MKLEILKVVVTFRIYCGVKGKSDKIEKPKAELKSQEEIDADLLLFKIKDVLSNG